MYCICATIKQTLAETQPVKAASCAPSRSWVERKPSAQRPHTDPAARSPMAPTMAWPPLDPRGLTHERDVAAKRQRLAVVSLSSVLKTGHGGDTSVSRGGCSQSLSTAVTDVAVEAAVSKLSSSGVRKDQAERVARVRSLTITDVKGKLVNLLRSTPSSHISK